MHVFVVNVCSTYVNEKVINLSTGARASRCALTLTKAAIGDDS